MVYILYFTLFNLLIPFRNGPRPTAAMVCRLLFDILLAFIDDLNICLLDLFFNSTGWRLQQKRRSRTSSRSLCYLLQNNYKFYANAMTSMHGTHPYRQIVLTKANSANERNMNAVHTMNHKSFDLM